MTFGTQNIPSTTETSPPAPTEKAPKGRPGSCAFSTECPTMAVGSTAEGTKHTKHDVKSSSSLPAVEGSSSPLASQVISRPAGTMEALSKATNAQTGTETTPVSQKAKIKAPHKERPVSKKKKTKKSFRSLLKGMMKGSGKPRDVEAERDALRTGLGGGAFIKIEKI